MPARDAWSSSAGRRVRLSCFERDRSADAPCHWCRMPIDYAAGPSDGHNPDAWEGDHLKPRKDYPELALEPGNIVPAHMHCNRERGAKAGLSELGRTSRDWFTL